MNATSKRRSDIARLPEMQSLAAPLHMVRVPPEINVPLTDRVRRLLDTRPMQRLHRISQLGLVKHVYPGATHSRMEHSLGVFRNALLFVQSLAATDRFLHLVDAQAVERLILAALLHDVGHWPFCHPVEDMCLQDMPEHEDRARKLLNEAEIAKCIRQDWQMEPDQIAALLIGDTASDQDRVLASVLSGPIDIDKLDYLMRDSLHCGVPYGRNFDAGRLVSALMVHPQHASLSVSEKGRTAAEMMVFSRYIMFSEVYWHHAVRSATAMLQRAVFLLSDRMDLAAMCDLDESAWIQRFSRLAEGTTTAPLVEGLFGFRRCLYKRTAQFSFLNDPELHGKLARRPYAWLVECSEALGKRLASSIGLPIGVADLLIDAPPQKLEVDINVDVVSTNRPIRTLGDVSPVAAALASQQFDHVVKQVRVFIRSDLKPHLSEGLIRRELKLTLESMDNP